MANHKAWMELPIVDKIQIIGKATHLIQNQFPYYIDILLLIQKAEDDGLFDDVKINNHD